MKIVLAGGGTGGHVFPAIAVAHALRELGATPHFIGSARGLEVSAVPNAGFSLSMLPLEPMKGGGMKRALRGGMLAASGVAMAVRELRRHRPAAVLGVGGYAAGPTCLAATSLRIPMTVLEPNAVLGFTNRVLAPIATRAYVAWAEAGVRFRSARETGVPVRAGFVAHELDPASPHRIVVLGGSQGASVFNRELPLVFAALRARGFELEVLHQTGKHSVPEVMDRYRELGVAVDVRSFVEDVPAAFAHADRIVARAGASTVAEILVAGRPSVLVPFPYAADDHQSANAAQVEAAGAGVHVREVHLARALPPILARLLASPERLTRMAEAAKRHGKPEAAVTIARDVLELAARGRYAR